MKKLLFVFYTAVLLPLGALELEFDPQAQGKEFLLQSVSDFEGIVGKMAKKKQPPRISVKVSPRHPFNVQDAKINAADGKIEISASSGLGASNALYKLLDLWGCRFITPGELGEIIPENSDFQLPDGEIPVKISFDTRIGAMSGSSEFNLWRKRNQRAHIHWITAQHYWFYAMPPSKYFEDHPEYYALIGGKRVPTQLCVSNPEVRDLMAKISVENLKSRPGLQCFPMDPEDNFEHCQCPECVKLDGRVVYYNGYKNLTNRIADFANHVARYLQKNMPGMMVGFYGYANKKLPPDIPLEKNVYVPVTRDSSCCLHLMPNDKCPTGHEFWRLLKLWLKAGDFIAVYEYDPISWIGGLPCPIYLERAHAIKLQHRMGVKGIVNDSGPVRDAANYVNCYLEIRMIADASRIPEKELEEMCLAYFGPKAGPLMNRYYLELAKVTGNHLDIRWGIDGYERIFTPEIMKETRRLLNEAHKSVGTGEKKIKRRLNVVELEQQYLEAFIRFFDNIPEKDFETSRKDIARVYQAVDQLAACPDANFNDPEDSKRRIRNCEMKTFARVFYKELGFIRDWQLAGPFDNPDRDALIVAPAPELRSGRLFLNGRETAMSPYTSPNGFIDMRRACGDKVKPDTPYFYYAVSEYDAPEEGSAQLRVDSFNPFKVYLNGTMVYERRGLDEDCPDKRIVPVRLKKGRNTVVVLLDQHVTSPLSNVGFWLRFTDTAGVPYHQASGSSPAEKAALEKARKQAESGRLSNLVPNPGMENISDWRASSFGVWPPASAPNFSVDTTRAFEGKQSIRFTGINSPVSFNRFFTVAPGERYLVTLRYAPGPGCKGTCVLDINWRSKGVFNSDPNLYRAFSPVESDGIWREISGIVTVPPGQDELVFAVSVSGQNTGDFANIDQLGVYRLP